MAGLVWDIPPDKMLEDLAREYVLAIEKNIFKLAQAWAPNLESYMKENAPWTDRTANARQTLSGVAEKEGHLVYIELAHGMEYGIYLELANAGTYAIINPTIDAMGPKVWDSVKKILS